MPLTKPNKRWPHRELIGNDLCPIMRRWTLAGYEGNSGFRLYLHRFFSKSDDRDVHDHPCAFFTLCLFGSYEDVQPIGDEYAVKDRVRFGSFRYRPAEHIHRTKSGRWGTVTLVLVLPKSRKWGFYRDGQFWSAADYEATYGPAMRCE